MSDHIERVDTATCWVCEEIRECVVVRRLSVCPDDGAVLYPLTACEQCLTAMLATIKPSSGQ